MKIGLPRALVHYYYYPLWKKLFQQLGAEVVVSDVTTGRLIEKGIKVTASELCVPIKIFNAHIINLLEKGVDYCFVPRFVSTDGREWYCPKFLGLPALAQYSIPNLEKKLLVCDIRGTREDTCELKNYMPLCDILLVTKKQLKAALNEAKRYFEKFRTLCREGYAIDEAETILAGGRVPPPDSKPSITIGVMGYVYNVYDKFVSMDIINRLRKSGIGVKTFEMMDERDLENKKDSGIKPLFWTFTRKIYNAAKLLIEGKKVDGIIHVTAFACGPDSVIGKMLEIDCEKENVPFMTIRVDEHSGENHLQTRIEAFCDMLIRKKSQGVVS